jgi:hypothetical protein
VGHAGAIIDALSGDTLLLVSSPVEGGLLGFWRLSLRDLGQPGWLHVVLRLDATGLAAVLAVHDDGSIVGLEDSDFLIRIALIVQGIQTGVVISVELLQYSRILERLTLIMNEKWMRGFFAVGTFHTPQDIQIRVLMLWRESKLVSAVTKRTKLALNEPARLHLAFVDLL